MTNRENADIFCTEWLEGKQVFTLKTSGSTGAPKIIELRRDQMIASAKKTISTLDLRRGMTALVCLDVNYVAGRMMLVRSMIAGMNMIVVEPSGNPLAGLSDERIDFAAMVPLQLAQIIRSHQRHRLQSIGKIILGGAPISQVLLREIEYMPNAVYATFGMTETITHIALQKLSGNDKQDYFETLDGIDIRTDERGCLVIRADYLDNTVVTNDVVELIDSRTFRWLGRFDNVINSGAIKIFPEKIEKTVGGYFLSKNIGNQFFVAGKAHEEFGEQVVLVIEGVISKENEKELIAYLTTVLGKYEIPKQVLYNERFAMTSTQKVHRNLSLENALPRPSGR